MATALMKSLQCPLGILSCNTRFAKVKFRLKNAQLETILNSYPKGKIIQGQLSWGEFQPNSNQVIDLLCKSMDWFLFDRDLRHEGVKLRNSLSKQLDCLVDTYYDTAQKMKFSIKDFFSKCDQIRSFLRIWSHLLNKSLMVNFIFCAV